MMILKIESLVPSATLTGIALLAVSYGCAAPEPPARVAPAAVSGITRVHQVDAQLLTGSSPDDQGYRQLRALGVDVVLSVDGPEPPVEIIRSLGMRSIHLPIGYDGVPLAVTRSLARLAQESPQATLYVHCHQGMHRGPAVAAILLRLRGAGSAEDASAILSACGTSPEYVGLWTSVEDFTAPQGSCADAPLPELVQPDPLVRHMDRIQELRDRLDDSSLGRLDAASNVLLLKDAFVELQRLHQPSSTARAERWNHDIQLTIELLDSMRSMPFPGLRQLARIDARCDSCHAASRH